MKAGDLVRVWDPYPHHPHLKSGTSAGKIGTIVDESVGWPRPLGGPTRFFVLVEDKVEVFAVQSLERL